jgi:hypothetical protein
VSQSAVEPEKPLAERAAEQRKQVKSACQSCGCWIGIVAAVALCSTGILSMLRHSVSPAGANVVVFMPATLVRNAMIASAIFAPFLFLFLASAKTTARFIGGAVVLVGAILTLAYLGWYRPVAAMVFHADTIELQYVWPRPSERLDPKDIVSFDYARGSREAVGSNIETYTLELRTRSRRIITFDDANFSDIQRAQQRIEAMMHR